MSYMLLMSTSAVSAQISPEASDAAARQAERLIQQQQLREQAEQEARDAQRQHTEPRQDQFKPKTPAPLDSTACSQIDTIELKGAQQLSKRQQRQLVAPYQGRCLSLNDMNQLLAEITQAYFDVGYITSRAYIPKQNLNDGRFEIVVIEGQLQTLESDTLKKKLLNMTFPVKPQRILNLRELEQGLDQINRLSSKQATLQLLPGDRPGDSRVQIQHQSVASPWRMVGRIDNSGQESTGETQAGVQFLLDNPLGLADFFSINVQTDSEARTHIGSDNLSLHYDWPYGYWNVDIDVSIFEYNSEVMSSLNRVRTSGESRNQSVRLSRLWWRNRQGKLSHRLAIKRKKSLNYLEETLLASSSRTLASANLEIDYQHTIKQGRWGITVAYDRGLDALGGEDDEGKSGVEPRAEFSTFRFNGYYTKSLSMAAYPLSYQANLYSQYSDDSLFAAEQISLGSQYTVRGYQQHGVSGGKGGYLRQEIGGRLPVGPRWLGRWQWGLGIDWGHVEDSEHDGTDLAGYGLQLRTVGQALTVSLELAKAWHPPEHLDPDTLDVYLSLSYQYPH